MKIVTNTIPLMSPLTGVGNYTRNLVTEFATLRPDIRYSYYYGYFTRKLNPSRRKYYYYLKTLFNKVPVISSQIRKLKFLLAGMQISNYDVYFEPNFIPLPIRAKKTVTTIHDFSFNIHPEWLPRDRLDYFSANFFKRINKSDVIVTVSEYIKNEAADILKRDDNRIVTIPNGYNSDIFNITGKNADYPGEPYILFIGSIEPRKNLMNLLKAYSVLPENIRQEFRLMLAGFEGWNNREVMDLIEKLNGRVFYLGYVDDERLASLYKNASCFVYPSFYEGFGLPPLEAMACGCPVIVSNAAGLPETCGDAAYYIDPHNVESIAEGIYTVLTNNAMRDIRVSCGLERIKLFSWEKSAKEHLRVFEEVAGS